MSDVINVTITEIVDVINIKQTELPPLKVSFYNEAIPDERVIKALSDAQKARDESVSAKNESITYRDEAATFSSNASDSADSASQSASSAENSAQEASQSEQNALDYKESASLSAMSAIESSSQALASKNSAEVSAISANDSKVSAQGSASSALNSANLAQQAADSVLFNDVIFVTFAMSPIVVDDSYRGAMLACDASDGEIDILLPEIGDLDLNFPWTVSAKKTDGSGNGIRIVAAVGDTVDGFATKTILAPNSGVTLVPDVDPDPDTWTSVEFGASAGNIVKDEFNGDGVTTDFELSVSPGSKNNTSVYVFGIYQKKSSYTLIDNIIKFNDPPLEGINNIEVTSGTILSIGVPADDSVTLEKLTQSLVDQLVPPGVILDFGGPLSNVPNGYLPVDNTIEYQASDYPRLARAFWDTVNERYVHGGTGVFPEGTFRTPPAGYFKRGIDSSGINDPDANARTASSLGGATGNNVGAIQSDALQSFSFNQSAGGTLRGPRIVTSDNIPSPGTRPFSEIAPTLRMGLDTRPKNYLVAQIIKY